MRPRYALATPGYLGESAHLTPRTPENPRTFPCFTPPSRISPPPPLRRAPVRPRYAPATPEYLGESAHLTPRTPENSGTFRYFTPTSRVPSPPPLRRAHLRRRYAPTTPSGGQQTQSTPSDSRPSSCTGGVSPTSPATPRSLRESTQQTQGRPCNLEGPPGASPRSSPAPSGSIRTTPLSPGCCSVIPRLRRKLARHTRAACGDSQTPARASPVPLISTPPGPRDSPVSLSCSPATPRSSREPDQETQATASGDSQVSYVTAGSPSSPAALGDASVSPSHSPDTPRSQRDSAQQTQGTPSSSQSSPGASSESSVSFYVTFNNCPMSPSHSPSSPRFQESARYTPESSGNSQESPHSPVSPVSSPLAHGDFAESPSYSTFPRSPGETGRLTQETPMCRYTSLSPFPMSDLLPRVLRDSPRPPGYSHTTRRFVPESAHHPGEAPHDSQTTPDGSPLPVTCIVTAPACALVAIPSSSASLGQPQGSQATAPHDPVSCSCRRDPLSFHPHPHACPSSCYCHSVARRRSTCNGQCHHPGRCPPQWGRVMSLPANARMHLAAFMPTDHTSSDRAGMTRPAWW
nr:DNA-directed RNA polymerase II subunit RPB1 [Oryctolagus cuniculus]